VLYHAFLQNYEIKFPEITHLVFVLCPKRQILLIQFMNWLFSKDNLSHKSSEIDATWCGLHVMSILGLLRWSAVIEVPLLKQQLFFHLIKLGLTLSFIRGKLSSLEKVCC
jgi:hypothetical protein